MTSETGIREKVIVTEEYDLNGTANLKQEIKISKDRDFNVNYVVLDFLFQGITDEPTEAEKLAKLGTWNIVTKGSGAWGTDLDADDIYYRYLARLENGQPSFLIGDGGGDNDYHGMRIILDAGGGKSVNSDFAWTPELEAVLKMNLLTDTGLDNGKVMVELVGYRGTKPRAVVSVENKEVTFGAKGDLSKFSVNAGEQLQEAFAFLTTELNLATIQDPTVFGIQEVQVRTGDQEPPRLKYEVNQMIDGINDGGEGNIQQYVRKSFDPEFQGFAYPLLKDDIVAFKAGVAEATRMYLTRVQPVKVV